MKRGMMTMAVLLVAGSLVAAEEAAKPADPAFEYKIYGKLHGSVSRINDGSNSRMYLSSNSSRLGIKGGMNLKECLKAIWQMEALINIDESGSVLASRDTYIGLDCTQCGKFMFGRFDTPSKSLGRKLDLFGDQIGDTRNIFSVGSPAGFDLRGDNMMMYVSPSIEGLVGSVAYKTTDEVKDSDIASGSLSWTYKSLMIGASVEQHGTMVSGTDTNKDGKVDIASTDRELCTRVGASWAVGQFVVNGMYEMISNDGGVKGADRDTFGGGVAYTWDEIRLKAQYYSSGATKDRPSTGADMMAFGVDYSLNKSAQVYLAYAKVMNAPNASVPVSGGGFGDKVVPSAGKDTSGVSAGMIYCF